jgi:hypothetical protein
MMEISPVDGVSSAAVVAMALSRVSPIQPRAQEGWMTPMCSLGGLRVERLGNSD